MSDDLINRIQHAQVRAGEDVVIAHLKSQGLSPMPHEESKIDHFMQPKIKGYRQLNDTEAGLMNEAKALGVQFETLISHLRAYHVTQAELASARQAADGNDGAEFRRLVDAEPARWLAMGRTDIQTGVMKIVRSIAQPAS